MQFKLAPGYDILIFNNTAPRNGCLTLLDTGASVPVWTDTVEALKALYPDAHKSQDSVYIGGFGGNGSIVPLWILPTYTLSDNADTAIFHNMHVAVYELPIDANMILSANIIGTGVLTLGNNILTLELPYKQLFVSTTHNMHGLVNSIKVSVYTQAQRYSRTLEEVRHDIALYNLADDYDVTTTDIYSLLDEVIYGETTLTNEEIMEQIQKLVRSGS